MKIGLLYVTNNDKKGALNKDLAGGMGTYFSFKGSLSLRLLTYLKNRTVCLPVVSFGHLQAILKDQGHDVYYQENDTVNEEYDLLIIYGSLVDYKNENSVAERISKIYPNTKLMFFGTFPSVKPELFSGVSSVIVGEIESFFLHEFKKNKKYPKIIRVKSALDLDDLPTPDFTNFPIEKYSYSPAISEKPFLVLTSSKGCPFTCSYYCAYGMIQGSKYRIRSAKKVFNDIVTLKRKYKIKGIQFRDPTFGINKKQVEDLCNMLIKEKVNIKFGIETRLDLLDKKILSLMYRAGLRNINVGIETVNEEISKINKRQLIRVDHQEEIIKFCERIGIKISAFYILGLKGDTKETIKNTINYAIKLNTNVAQFTVSIPYPGTKYYDELLSKNIIEEDDFEKYNINNIVFKHDKLDGSVIKKMQEYAFRKYYFRFGYLLRYLKWRVKEF